MRTSSIDGGKSPLGARPTIVLKFGGSVLRDEGSLSEVVEEIRRWRLDGAAVVAVVSALAGVTDTLFASCPVRAGEDAVADRVADGELRCAELLGEALRRSGLSARVLGPREIGLVAEGPPLDADPCELDAPFVLAALESGETLVVPGYVARNREGRRVLLGRGGSDLTAIFLAERLDAARCRLIKDVDGVYAGDPGLSDSPPARYTRITWADALASESTIVQPKAVRFAADVGRCFELGSLGDVAPTLVGAAHTEREARPAPGGEARG